MRDSRDVMRAILAEISRYTDKQTSLKCLTYLTKVRLKTVNPEITINLCGAKKRSGEKRALTGA